MKLCAGSLAWISVGAGLAAPGAIAQIVPDVTLPNPSIVESRGDIQAGQTLTVDGGSLAGANLFHSFEAFSIPVDVTVELLGTGSLDPTLANIFLRVTGDRPSQIDGQLRAPGTAAVFLLNPNGITFGETARLEVGGLFLASSADRLIFADGLSWGTGANATRATTTAPLLSLDVPIGLQFDSRSLDATSGEITVLGGGQREILAGDPGSEPLLEQIRTANANVDVDSLSSLFATVGIAGEGLEAAEGQAIALVGREVTVAGGLLRVPGGAIALASPTAGQVSLTGDIAQPLSFEEVTAWGNVLTTAAAAIDTSGNSSGNLTIRGENVTIADGTIIFARPLGNDSGSELLLQAEDTLRFQGVGQVNGETQGNALLGGTIGEASGSNITLRSPTVHLDDGAVISSITFSGSQGGNITIEASDRVVLDGDGTEGVRCCTRVLADSRNAGNAGNIAIDTPLLQMTDGAQFASRAFQSGDGGEIAVRAADVELRGSIPITAVASVPVTNFFGTRFPTGLFTVSRVGSTGNSGSIRVESDRLLVDDLAEIQVTTFGSGQGGTLSLNATESITISNPTGVALTEPDTTTMVGNQSFLQRDPSLSAFSELTLIGAGTIDSGNGGNLTINTGTLNLTNSTILAGTLGTGNGGQLEINARDRVQLNGSSVFAGSSRGEGDSGNLRLTTPSLDLEGGSVISAATVNNSTGSAGSVMLQVSDRVRLSEDSQITATTEQGNGGNVTLSSGLLQLSDRSLLTAASRSTDLENPGDGGNLDLNSELVVLFDNSQISANALTGNGGNIAIVTQGLYQASDSRITASSALGLAGVVNVSTPDIDSTASAVQLSDDVAEEDAIVLDHCQGAGDRFTISHTGGFPTDPFAHIVLPLPTAVQPEWLSQAGAEPVSAGQRMIVEARGWSRVDGQLRRSAEQPLVQVLVACLLRDRR